MIIIYLTLYSPCDPRGETPSSTKRRPIRSRLPVAVISHAKFWYKLLLLTVFSFFRFTSAYLCFSFVLVGFFSESSQLQIKSSAKFSFRSLSQSSSTLATFRFRPVRLPDRQRRRGRAGRRDGAGGARRPPPSPHPPRGLLDASSAGERALLWSAKP